jgi:hypothetical protein
VWFGLVRLGYIRLDMFRLVKARLGYFRLYCIMLVQGELGCVQLGSVWLGWVVLDYLSLG